jgi:hypothetical protein
MSVSGKSRLGDTWFFGFQFSSGRILVHTLCPVGFLYINTWCLFFSFFEDEEVCKYRVVTICSVCSSLDYVSVSAGNFQSLSFHSSTFVSMSVSYSSLR